MGISSLGVGSNVLTQAVLDKLKAVDKSQFVTPKNTKLSSEKDKSSTFKALDALMNNVYTSLQSLNEYGVFEARTATSSDEAAVTVTAAVSSDIQDFSLDITTLATKEIEQSGQFTTSDATIASGAGTFELAVGSTTYNIAYDTSTTLTDLKDLINKTAGVSIDATVVQVATNDFRLMFSANSSGTGQVISITDLGNDGAGTNPTLSTSLTTGMANVQTAVDASFKFNGLSITRTSNSINDLLSGVTVNLKTTGKSNISVKQDSANIASKVTNFLDKYNSALFQIEIDTKSSQNVNERGVFSSDSTMKTMKRAMQDILKTVGQGVGTIGEYGIIVDNSGRLSLDATVLNAKLADNPTNAQSFFTGGTFTKNNGISVEVLGIFEEMGTEFGHYSKRGAILDDYKTALDDRITSITKQRDIAIKRLNAKYEIMKKQWAAYDLQISQLNAASTTFTQLSNSFQNAQNNP